MPRLYEIAHGRAGDKGNTSNISVIAYEAASWEFLRSRLTTQIVQRHFAHLLEPGARITRYELPRLQALNFVLEGALAGGVTRSLAQDAHGKSLSSLMLTIELGD
jgi:hypothetical protein